MEQRRKRTGSAVCLCATLFCAITAVRAEVVILKDGSRLVGTISSRSDSEIVLSTGNGELRIEQYRILRIEYPDSQATRVSLKDGTVLVGRIEEQKADAIVLSTAVGVLTLAKDRIGQIEYGNSPPTIGPVLAGLPKERVGVELRASVLAPFGQGGAGLAAGSGGALSLWARRAESGMALGLEVGYGGFHSKDRARSLSFASAHANVGWAYYFQANRFVLFPFLGVGAAMVTSTRELPEADFVGSYFTDRGDTVGLLLSTQDLSSPDLKTVAALHFLPRGDGVGYLLSDRRNFTSQRSGVSPSALIGFTTRYLFESNVGLGITLQSGGIGDGGGTLGYGGLSVQISWNF